MSFLHRVSTPRRLIVALFAALLVLAGFATYQIHQASSAEAASSSECNDQDSEAPEVTGYSPHYVVVGLSPVERKFSVKATDNCAVVGWWLSIRGDWVTAADDHPAVTIPVPTSTTFAGTSEAYVEAMDPSFNTTLEKFPFKLKRATLWGTGTLNATPEPVAKGKPVTIKGQLKVANWSKRTYDVYGGRRIAVQFKPSGAAAYQTVKYVYTGSTGWVSTTATATVDGVWRLYYGGNAIAGSATSVGDYVDVK